MAWSHLTESVYKGNLQNSIPSQIRQIILYHYQYKESIVEFVRESTVRTIRVRQKLKDLVAWLDFTGNSLPSHNLNPRRAHESLAYVRQSSTYKTVKEILPISDSQGHSHIRPSRKHIRQSITHQTAKEILLPPTTLTPAARTNHWHI